MAGRGMGAATRGGGCVGTGPKNKVQSKPFKFKEARIKMWPRKLYK